MSIKGIIDRIIPRGAVRINDQTTRISTNKLRKFTDKMQEQGFGTEVIRPCSHQEVTEYLKAMNGIFPKLPAASTDETHKYVFTQAHGAAQIYDSTENKDVVTIIERILL